MPEKPEIEKHLIKTIKQLQQQIQQQEKLLNEILSEVKKDSLPTPPTPSKSPLSILENLDFDMEKVTKIALFISSLYANSNEDKV